MKCPIDGSTLVIAERAGVEIDHCPTCRGVWLDRGELDKLIERSTVPRDHRRDPKVSNGDRYGHSRSPRKRKMSGLLEDIFDF
ncbi:hypothetical protein HGD87_00065 [Rhodobacteraceae bacterium R_SAG9]|nr:hypothetical protein [Rhodobacteraceae bacterium R_SAG9]